jgi:tetratricopeptide (TPR) repeat protein
LEADYDNVRAALQTAIESDRDIARASRICASLVTFWVVRGYGKEAAMWCDAATRLVNPDSINSDLATIYSARGSLIYVQTRFAEAKECFLKALMIRDKLGDLQGVAGILERLSSIAMRTGRSEEAIDLLNRAAETARASGNLKVLAYTGITRGCLLMDEVDTTEARGCYEEVVSITEQTGDMITQAIALCNMSHLLWRDGERDEARSMMDRSARMFEECSDRGGIAITLFGRAEMEFSIPDLKAARVFAQRALHEWNDLGSRGHALIAIELLAYITILESPEDKSRLLQSARLLGATARWRDELQAMPSDTAAQSRAKHTADLEALIGADTLRTTMAAGRMMALEEAVLLASGETRHFAVCTSSMAMA